MRNLIGLLALLVLLPVLTAQAQDEALWLRDSAISPDGSTIAFTYQGDIYTVPVPGGEARQITTWTGRDLAPVWSPDGSTLAFASDRYGNLDVFTVGAAGGAPTRLTFDSRDDRPSTWTRDGGAVLFESARLDAAASANFPTGRQPELYSVPAEGGRVTQLLTVPVINEVQIPTFLPHVASPALIEIEKRMGERKSSRKKIVDAGDVIPT